MELNEEQKARAQKLAGEVGKDPGKYFSDALFAVFKKGNDEIKSLVNNLEIKLKLGERYSQVSKLAEKVLAEIAVVREAYQIWYEGNGKDLVEEKKASLKLQFDEEVVAFESLLAQLKVIADDIAELFKKK